MRHCLILYMCCKPTYTRGSSVYEAQTSPSTHAHPKTTGHSISASMPASMVHSTVKEDSSLPWDETTVITKFSRVSYTTELRVTQCVCH